MQHFKLEVSARVGEGGFFRNLFDHVQFANIPTKDPWKKSTWSRQDNLGCRRFMAEDKRHFWSLCYVAGNQYRCAMCHLFYLLTQLDTIMD